MLRQVPNALSILRLGMAAVFPICSPWWWPILIALAAVTDFADGMLARRLGVMSWVGGLLDGIADKAFTFSALVTFAFTGRIEWWQVALLVARDLVVGSIAGYAALQRRWAAFQAMPARLAGKLTTAAMFILLLVVVVGPAPGATIIFWMTAGFSVIAAVDYAWQFGRREFAAP